MGEGLFIVEVTELVVEGAVLVVANFDHAVFYAEGVAEVHAYVVVVDLYDPVVEVFSVEKGDPFVGGEFGAVAGREDERDG